MNGDGKVTEIAARAMVTEPSSSGCRIMACRSGRNVLEVIALSVLEEHRKVGAKRSAQHKPMRNYTPKVTIVWHCRRHTVIHESFTAADRDTYIGLTASAPTPSRVRLANDWLDYFSRAGPDYHFLD